MPGGTNWASLGADVARGSRVIRALRVAESLAHSSTALTASPALFVYYKLPASLSPDWPHWVAASLAAVTTRHPLLNTRLMRRADASIEADTGTWMEVYEHPDGVNQALEAEILQATAKLNPHLLGARHIERFVDVVPSSTPPTLACGHAPLGQT